MTGRNNYQAPPRPDRGEVITAELFEGYADSIDSVARLVTHQSDVPPSDAPGGNVDDTLGGVALGVQSTTGTITEAVVVEVTHPTSGAVVGHVNETYYTQLEWTLPGGAFGLDRDIILRLPIAALVT